MAKKLSDTIKDILDTTVEERKTTGHSQIELFMDWIFSNFDFRINGLTYRVEFKVIGEKNYIELDDIKLNSMKILAEMQGFGKSFQDKLKRIIFSDYVPIVNEIKDYFENIKSNAQKIKITEKNIELPTVRKYFEMITLKNNQTYEIEQHYNIFVRFFIASVNSALRRKHNDVMLVLSGAQGTMKTSFLNHLTPVNLGKEKYLYVGHIEPNLKNSNTANALCERFFINVDDQLEVIFGKEYNNMKAIISIDQVTSRRAYAEFEKTRKRIANFVGSVNSAEFLTDNTNRRYFVLEIDKINPEYNKIDMDLFWAECYQASLQINPFEVYGKEIYNQIIKIAENFVESSIENILINKFFKNSKSDQYPSEIFMTTGEIFLELQKMHAQKLYKNAIANELKRLKFENYQKRTKRFEYPQRGYRLFCKSEDEVNRFNDYTI